MQQALKTQVFFSGGSRARPEAGTCNQHDENLNENKENLQVA
jgi:hypothetical protein